MNDTLTRKRELLDVHIANVEYVTLFHVYFRAWRGTVSQEAVAVMADVSQPYISRVEAGLTNGIGYEALCRILDVYQEFIYVSRPVDRD